MTKGNVGYIDYIKKKNCRRGIGGIVIMFVIYISGLMITGGNSNYATLLAILLALPSAQFLARYLSLKGYASVDSDLEDSINKTGITKALYELVWVYNNRNYFLIASAMTEEGLILLTKCKDISNKDVKEFLENKGIFIPVILINDRKVFLEKLQTGISSEDFLPLNKLLENSL